MPTTEILKVSSDQPEPRLIRRAAEVLRAGGLVAFPTETVYGLGADALNLDAVQKVFEAKGRPPDNPLIVHIADLNQVSELARELPEKGKRLAESFWPGPLTLVLKRTRLVPDIVTAHLDTVAVRIPKHPVTLALIESLGHGIVGPSANLSGRPSPTTAAHVYEDLNGRVEIILDAGPTDIGVESTVVDVSVDPPSILRQGGLTKEKIEATIGPVQSTKRDDLLRRSPGTRHRHYAPRAWVVLVQRKDSDEFVRLANTFHTEGKNVGSITHSLFLTGMSPGQNHRVLQSDPVLFAKEIFRALRELDALGLDVILVESVEEVGVGVAVMDRLRRAAQA